MKPKTSQVEQALLPCPFDGELESVLLRPDFLHPRSLDKVRGWARMCNRCGCRTSVCETEADANGRWNTRPDAGNDPDLTCIDGMINGLPCPHCDKAVERFIAQNVRTVTTTGAVAQSNPEAAANRDKLERIEKELREILEEFMTDEQGESEIEEGVECG